MKCNGFQLPNGNVYINEVKEKNIIMNIDISNYDDFISECSFLFDNYDDVEELIYIDEINHFELTKEKYDELKESMVL